MLKGKKTYLVAVATAVVGVIAAFGVVIPVWVWPVLGSLGLGFLRSGINNTLEKTKEMVS